MMQVTITFKVDHGYDTPVNVSKTISVPAEPTEYGDPKVAAGYDRAAVALREQVPSLLSEAVRMAEKLHEDDARHVRGKNAEAAVKSEG